MVRLFAIGAIASIFTACGAQADAGGAARSSNGGGNASSAGGNTSIPSSTTGGSMAISNGGSTATSLTTYCNGKFAGYCGSVLEQVVNVTSCDVQLQRSPPTSMVLVAINCNLISQTNPDADAPGFYIDYSQSPAHLRLTGPTCTNLLTNGLQSLVVIETCLE